MKRMIHGLAIIAALALVGCSPDSPSVTGPEGDSGTAGEIKLEAYAPNILYVDMYQVTPDKVGKKIGTIKIRQLDEGLVFNPKILGLSEGLHGFHIHQNPSCEPGEKDGEKVAALAAGGHYDPENTGEHAGPDGEGHLGDLPMLRVNSDGTQQEIIVNGLQLDRIRNRSLVVHQGKDDYSTDPAGNSGPRIACGVIR